MCGIPQLQCQVQQPQYLRPCGICLCYTHGFAVAVDDALLQSIPPDEAGCIIGVDEVVGDIILFILRPAFIGCLEGGEKLDDPMPGFVGTIAGNDELRVLRVLSGVIVLCVPCGAARLVVGGGEIGGELHEKVAAGDALLEERARLAEGREGKIVDEEAEAGIHMDRGYGGRCVNLESWKSEAYEVH